MRNIKNLALVFMLLMISILAKADTTNYSFSNSDISVLLQIQKSIINVTNTVNQTIFTTNVTQQTNTTQLFNTNTIVVFVTNNPPGITNPAPPITNNPPVNTTTPSVYAGGNKTITTFTTTITGRVQTPTNGVTTTWIQVSGPGNSVISNSTALISAVTFSMNGTYDLRFTAHNGALAGSDDSIITVSVPNGSGPVITNPPPPILTNPAPPITNPPPTLTNNPPTTNAAIFFVRKGATGANNGLDWNNAWTNTTQIQWSFVKPGNKIYIAGGTYSPFTLGANGSSDSQRITIYRAMTNFADCVNAAGWNSSYNSQVIINDGSSTGISFGGFGNWVTIEGVVDSGIVINTPNNDGASISFDKGTTGVTLEYLDLSGPGGSTPVTMGGDNRGIDATAWNGSVYEPINNLILRNCRIHGQVNNLWLMQVHNSTIEHNKFYDSAAANSTTYHANVVATSSSTNIVWRYNEIYNHQVEGIMMIFGGAANWYIYDNLWHDGMTGVSRILEVQDGVEGPIYYYNNTAYNVVMGLRTANGGSYAAGSQARNNIFWNCAMYDGLTDVDYDLCNSSQSESHGITTSVNPFLSTSNLHLSTSSPATGKGINLGTTYSLDFDGNTRINPWDIGAFKF